MYLNAPTAHSHSVLTGPGYTINNADTEGEAQAKTVAQSSPHHEVRPEVLQTIGFHHPTRTECARPFPQRLPTLRRLATLDEWNGVVAGIVLGYRTLGLLR